MKNIFILLILLLSTTGWAQIDTDKVQLADDAYREAKEKLDHKISYTVLIGYGDEVVEKFKKDHLNSFHSQRDREVFAVDTANDLPRMFKFGANCSAYSFNIENDNYICFEKHLTGSSSDHLRVILDLLAVDKAKSSDVTSIESRRLDGRLKFLGDVSIMRDERFVKNDGLYAVVNTRLASLNDLKIIRRFFQSNDSGVFLYKDETDISNSIFPVVKGCSIYFINKRDEKTICIDELKKTKILDNITTLYLISKIR